MTVLYPVVLTKLNDGYLVDIPDFGVTTEGKDLAEAIYMARDALSLVAVDMQDDGKPLPESTAVKDVSVEDGQIVSLVDADLDAYRSRLNNRAVRKNVSIPEWMATLAEKQGISLSQTLQDALKERFSHA